MSEDNTENPAPQEDEATYEVGYGKPPKEHQFKKGQRRPGPGRPRGSQNRKTMITRVANEKLEIEENGKRVKRSALDLVIRTVGQKAAQGDLRALRLARELFGVFGEEEPEPGTYGYLFLPEMPDSLEERCRLMAIPIVDETGELIYDPATDEEGKKLRDSLPGTDWFFSDHIPRP